MPSPFELASAVTRVDTDRFRATIPDGWAQGRGAFGGLVLATMLRAIEASEADRTRVVRTLIGDLAGPVLAGDAEVRVVVARRGSNQTNVRAELAQGGEVLAHASAVLSTPRPRGIDARPRAAAHPGVNEVPAVPMGPPRTPVFTQHYEYRPVGGGPFGVRAEPTASGWVREIVAPDTVDAPALIALLDAWWPAFFSTTPAFRPVATVSFTAEILCDPRALDPRAPLFYAARTVAEHEGFQLEARELYDARGEIVAMNQQTFAVIK
jgi:acyl-CoA thioesterase